MPWHLENKVLRGSMLPKRFLRLDHKLLQPSQHLTVQFQTKHKVSVCGMSLPPRNSVICSSFSTCHMPKVTNQKAVLHGGDMLQTTASCHIGQHLVSFPLENCSSYRWRKFSLNHYVAETYHMHSCDRPTKEETYASDTNCKRDGSSHYSIGSSDNAFSDIQNLEFDCELQISENSTLDACSLPFMSACVAPMNQRRSLFASDIMLSYLASGPTDQEKNFPASILPLPYSNSSTSSVLPGLLPRKCRALGGVECIDFQRQTRNPCRQDSRSFSTLSSSRCTSLLSPDAPWRASSLSFTKTVPIPDDEVTTSSIQTFLKDNKIKFHQGFTCFQSVCPRASKKRGQQQTANGDKLFINMRTGHFLCQHCNKIGGWREFQDNITFITSSRKRKDIECFQNVDSVQQLNVDSKTVAEVLSGSVAIAELSPDEYSRLMAEFGLSELKQSALEKYGVRCDNFVPHLLFPAHTLDNQIISVKKLYLRPVEGKTFKTVREITYPRLGFQGVFGLAAMAGMTGPFNGQNGLVLTTSELDALAVFQESGRPALALTKGMTTLPQEVLPSLEHCDKLTLWFGSDVRAWEASKQFAIKLGTARCHVIRPSPEDPGPWAALQRGLRLSNTLGKARPVTHKSIVSFSQLRQEVFSELSHVEQVAGVKWRRYPTLNRLLKGHRRGELTVFTGPTGSGKTTFMSDYSLDLAMQGVSTLWGSFEINNVRLGKMMLTQFAQKSFQKNLDQFDYWADRFEEIPMYFMTFHGQESVKKVVEAMSHAVYVHDIAHVVVDNLQFMMGSNGEWSDKFQKQDMIVSAFRKFSTTMNCHVTLVIHPRKEKDSEDLTTASVFGSAKATQEADNVLILQDKRLMAMRGKKYIQVTKNRFDGELGVMLLKFDKETLSFSVREKPQKPARDQESKPSSEEAPEDQASLQS